VLIATWNLNNRFGAVRFRLEAAEASAAIGADLLVFTEYFPKDNHARFAGVLAAAGWTHLMVSADSGEPANRVLVASRVPLEPYALQLPDFDRQFRSNLLGASISSLGIRIVGVRVPAYSNRNSLIKSWEWLEATAESLAGAPSIILGDLNFAPTPTRGPAGASFHRILQAGWHRAAPSGAASYFGHNGARTEIDHILATKSCDLSEARYVTEAGGFRLAGDREAISDHAAVLARVRVLEAEAEIGRLTDERARNS